MTVRAWKLALIGTMAILAGAWIFESFTSCALAESQAKQIVLAELSRAGLDPSLLRGQNPPRSCSYDFHYEGNGRTISYVVADDLLHGPELHRWDYAEGANGP